MNSSEIRKANILYLIETLFQGNIVEFSKKINRSESTIRRLFFENTKNSRNVGDAMARNIEKCLKLDIDCLDLPNMKKHKLVCITDIDDLVDGEFYHLRLPNRKDWIVRMYSPSSKAFTKFGCVNVGRSLALKGEVVRLEPNPYKFLD